MTPYDIIQNEERKLKERLQEKVADIITQECQNFTDITGSKIGTVSFELMDVSTIDKKQMIFHSLNISKDNP